MSESNPTTPTTTSTTTTTATTSATTTATTSATTTSTTSTASTTLKTTLSANTASNQWIPPNLGNPDLDPLGDGNNRPNIGPFTPRGMLFDPRDLINQSGPTGQPAGPDSSLPPGARFDPFGPPDPSQVGPGRGPKQPMGFKPNPDHFPPPGPNGPGGGFF